MPPARISKSSSTAAGPSPSGSSTLRSRPASSAKARLRCRRCTRARSAGGRPRPDRLTDWLVRPLKTSQLEYAASDVVHLLEIHDRLASRLRELGRLGWAEVEFDLLLERGRRIQRPEDAWTRLKDVRHLRRRDLPVVRSVAMWREQRAAKVNQPVRHVLPDMAVVSIARSAPRTTEDLAAVRGVGEGMARGRLGPAILKAVADGLASTGARRRRRGGAPTTPSASVPRWAWSRPGWVSSPGSA